jgi:hypothetical protein
MSWARATTARVHQRREDGAAADAPGRFEDMTTTIYGTAEFRNHRVSERLSFRTIEFQNRSVSSTATVKGEPQ